MAYEMVMPYHLHMPSYFLETFTEYPVIEGWQLALQRMHVGDKWVVYIPYTMGYGNRTSGPIPAFSTLIFEVELLGIA